MGQDCPPVTLPDRKRGTVDLEPLRKRQKRPKTKPKGYIYVLDEDITSFKEKIVGTREVDGAKYYVLVCPVLISAKCIRESLISEYNEVGIYSRNSNLESFIRS